MSEDPRTLYRRHVWPMPLRAETADDAPRRVGVELEFIGLTPQQAAEILQAQFGGTLEPRSDYEIAVNGTRHGDYNVELDFSYLKKRGRSKDDRSSDSLEDLAEDLAEGVIALVARRVVPLEIVTPPIPMQDLWELEDLIRALREAGAKGTHSAPTYAFGLHCNPELPALDADTLRRYLQAFMCLYPWLLQRSEIDLSRRITPYIDPFPKAYLQRVLQPDYAPDMNTLIDDYLADNPTRNRALDMLPLFRHLDEERVLATLDDDRIKARPTLHYRLPNCAIDAPDWQLVHPWRDLLQLDALANEPELLARACAECVRRLGLLGEVRFGNWADAAYAWVLPELL